MSVLQLRRQLFDSYPTSSGQEYSQAPNFDIGGDEINPNIGFQTADDMFRSTEPTFDQGYTQPDPETERLDPRWAKPYQSPTAETVDQPSTVLRNPLDSRTEDSIDLEAELNKISAPEHEALDRYNALLRQFPENERPNIMRRIAASAGGFTHGVDEARKVMEEPNVRNLAQWKEKVTPEYNAVQAETARNNTNRQLATTFLTNTVNERRNAATAKNQEERNRLQQQRNEILAMHEAGAGWKFLPMADGYLYGFKGTETFNTGVKANEFSPAQLMMLKIAGQIALKEAPKGGGTGTGTGTGTGGTGGTGTGTTEGAYYGGADPAKRLEARQAAFAALYDFDRTAHKHIAYDAATKTFSMKEMPTGSNAEINEWLAVAKRIAQAGGIPPGGDEAGYTKIPDLPPDYNGPEPGFGTEPEGRNPDGSVRPNSALHKFQQQEYLKKHPPAGAAPTAPGKGWWETGVTEGVPPPDPNKGWFENPVLSSIFGGKSAEKPKAGLPPGMETAINAGGAAYGAASNWYKDLIASTKANEPGQQLPIDFGPSVPANAQPTMPVRPPVNPSLVPIPNGPATTPNMTPIPPNTSTAPPRATPIPNMPPMGGIEAGWDPNMGETIRPPGPVDPVRTAPPVKGGMPNAPFQQNQALDTKLPNIQLFMPNGQPAYYNGAEAWIEPTLENIQKAKQHGYTIFVGGQNPQPARPVPPPTRQIPQQPTSGPVPVRGGPNGSKVQDDVIMEGIRQGTIMMVRSPDGKTAKAIDPALKDEYIKQGWTPMPGGR